MQSSSETALKFNFPEDRLRDTLLETPILGGDAKAVEVVAEKGIFERFEKGQKLIVQGDSTDDVFFLLSGKVEVLIGGKVIEKRRSPNVVGEMAAKKPGSPRMADVVCVGSGLLTYRLSATDFRALVLQFSGIRSRLDEMTDNLLRVNADLAGQKKELSVRSSRSARFWSFVESHRVLALVTVLGFVVSVLALLFTVGVYLKDQVSDHDKSSLVALSSRSHYLSEIASDAIASHEACVLASSVDRCMTSAERAQNLAAMERLLKGLFGTINKELNCSTWSLTRSGAETRGIHETSLDVIRQASQQMTQVAAERLDREAKANLFLLTEKIVEVYRPADKFSVTNGAVTRGVRWEGLANSMPERQAQARELAAFSVDVCLSLLDECSKPCVLQNSD